MGLDLDQAIKHPAQPALAVVRRGRHREEMRHAVGLAAVDVVGVVAARYDRERQALGALAAVLVLQ
jgi:hypothetical protein